MRVWVIDRSKNIIIDILPMDIWDRYDYDHFVSAYNLSYGSLNWIREEYGDYKESLLKYRTVL